MLLEFIESLTKIDDRSVQMSIRRFASRVRTVDTDMYKQISMKLSTDPHRSVKYLPEPVDSDSRLSLIRSENPVVLDSSPIHSLKLKAILEQVILEHEYRENLQSEGVSPSKSIIFQGPPGVGKTMSARWLASQLKLPLLTLDLSTVMSSYLGKTGSNVRSVLDYAMSFPCVLLLDEFDAIAKRRDDDREVGELKRLVTVLLQAVDDWPSSSLLIAATNHGSLLDPAIWRRFDVELTFDLPDREMIISYIKDFWPELSTKANRLASDFIGQSFSFIDRELRKAKRESIISGISIDACMNNSSLQGETNDLSYATKKRLVKSWFDEGMSQRSIAAKLGISRPTIKKIIDGNIKK